MKKEKTQTQVRALKFRIYPNKKGEAALRKCFAASRKYWNHQVAAQTENLKTWDSRKEEWAKDGGEKNLQDLKDKMEKDLGDEVYEKASDEHKAAQKEIRASGFAGMNCHLRAMWGL